MARTQKLSVENLTGIAETTLWPLYNRAAEARRSRPRLRDPWAVEIADSIAYDYRRSFGQPDSGFVQRALLLDELLRQWLAAHPNGCVAALGAGLDTQFLRVDNGHVQWLSVDLPEVITVRQRFIPDSPRHRNLPCSALDFRWMDEVPPLAGVFVTAAGLLQYLQPEEVRHVVGGIAARFPGAEMAFDRIPPWFKRMSLRGFKRTPHFTIPPMHWSLSDAEVPALKSWHQNISEVRDLPYVDGEKSFLDRLVGFIRTRRRQRDHVFSVVHVRCGT